jgi:arylsulfatase A-like enzyme/tetratricopeptide (TPR) repeat protein
VIAILAALASGACARPAEVAPQPTARNLLFITIDTLRADHVGVYGATNVATPNLDRLARDGALARHATVHVPLTRPSHVSIFTGRYPADHGIRDNVAPALRPDVPLMAEVLKASGFRTAGFVSSIVLARPSGLERGFDDFSDRFDVAEDDARFLNTIQRRGDVATGEAIAWMRAHAHDRFFVWVHLYDPHDPYEPPGRYAVDYADRPYDGEVAWSDELVGRLLSSLTELGAADQTLVVATSDHGEGLGDHGEAVHGYFVYETTLHVPFIARGPGVKAGSVINSVTRSVDLFPTVMEMLGLKDRAPATAGRSIAAGLHGEPLPDEQSFAESLVPLVHYGWSDLRAVRDGRWKYILAPRSELFDLDRDPGELTNLVQREPARARAMREGLERQLRTEQKTTRSTPAAATVPPELLEKLGALGYVSPGGSAEPGSAGADPKDKLEEYKTLNTEMRQGLIALREERSLEAAGHFRRLLRRGVDSFEAHYYLGRALTVLRRWKEADSEYEKAAKKFPAYGPAYIAIVESRVAMGDLAGALAAARRGQAAVPLEPRLFEREADILRRQGDLAAAAEAQAKVVRMAPSDALAKMKLGEIDRDLGRTADAIALLREAVALDPAQASYWNSLGMVLGGSGNLAEAERAFAEASKRDQNNPQYTYNRALALQRLGRASDAAPLFRRAAELGFGPARARLAEPKPDGSR